MPSFIHSNIHTPSTLPPNTQLLSASTSLSLYLRYKLLLPLHSHPHPTQPPQHALSFPPPTPLSQHRCPLRHMLIQSPHLLMRRPLPLVHKPRPCLDTPSLGHRARWDALLWLVGADVAFFLEGAGGGELNSTAGPAAVQLLLSTDAFLIQPLPPSSWGLMSLPTSLISHQFPLPPWRLP